MYRAIAGCILKTARLTRATGETGAVTLIQRFGSALNLNVHYKRPELFFADVERLKSIAARQPFQALFTGKAHPQDQGGKEAIERLHQWMREVAG